MDEVATVLAFERDLAERLATQIRELPFGVGLFTPELASVYDLNHVRVERSVDAAELVEVVDRAHAALGLRHRKIHVDDPALGAELVAPLREAGYEHERHELMVLRDGAPPTGDGDAPPIEDGGAVELALEDFAPLHRDLVASEPWAQRPEVVADFDARLGELARRAGARFFAAPAPAPVSGCLLLTDGTCGEIDEVVTLPEHRGHGYSSAVLTRAIAAARAAGLGPVFLFADADDWPRAWYARCGFETVSTVHEFTRRAGDG